MAEISGTWLIVWVAGTCLLAGVALVQSIVIRMLRQELSSLHYRGSLRPGDNHDSQSHR